MVFKSVTAAEFLRYTQVVFTLDLALIKDWVKARSGKALKHDQRNTMLLSFSIQRFILNFISVTCRM